MNCRSRRAIPAKRGEGQDVQTGLADVIAASSTC
jgi:hypothetical protein